MVISRALQLASSAPQRCRPAGEDGAEPLPAVTDWKRYGRTRPLEIRTRPLEIRTRPLEIRRSAALATRTRLIVPGIREQLSVQALVQRTHPLHPNAWNVHYYGIREENECSLGYHVCCEIWIMSALWVRYSNE
ncbi:hypothetical protein RRG08_017572 [Elysia crispata]|uniref:Uncharacterized protein n=1 Tax=Elysia crispata TaxID=231223 RepID=A0AAE1E6T4_9GAST|nr:hypothetical protein RRG08_017572 [Elysia crispata]